MAKIILGLFATVFYAMALGCIIAPPPLHSVDRMILSFMIAGVFCTLAFIISHKIEKL
ncbi:MAG: hypothetical protein KBA90_14740 [Chitinophagaceae bacterium]|nr:hypothetical protein [Chitinophagaceae bacterium]